MDKHVTKADLQKFGRVLGELDIAFDNLFGNIGIMSDEVIEFDVADLNDAMAALIWELRNI